LIHTQFGRKGQGKKKRDHKHLCFSCSTMSAVVS
jgi:hypothetical protein